MYNEIQSNFVLHVDIKYLIIRNKSDSSLHFTDYELKSTNACIYK
jgi:hypothetical protein